ncbi:MAG: hypothetical protein Q9178_001716 [Gyalolechia marmorata]
MTIKSIIDTLKLRQTAYANRRTPYLEREIEKLRAELAEAKRAFSARKDLRRQEQKEQPKKGGRAPSEPTKKEKALANAQLACQEADKAAEQARNIATLKHSEWQRAQQNGVTSITYRRKLWDEAQSLSTAADGKEQEARNAAQKVRKAEQSIQLAAERAQARRERGETLIDDVSSRQPASDDDLDDDVVTAMIKAADDAVGQPPVDGDNSAVRQPPVDDDDDWDDDLVTAMIKAADGAVGQPPVDGDNSAVRQPPVDDDDDWDDDFVNALADAADDAARKPPVDGDDSAARQPPVDEDDFNVASADDEDLESELSPPPESSGDDPIPPRVTRKRKALPSEASSIDTSDTDDDDEEPHDATNEAEWSIEERFRAFMLMDYEDLRTLAIEYCPTSVPAAGTRPITAVRRLGLDLTFSRNVPVPTQIERSSLNEMRWAGESVDDLVSKGSDWLRLEIARLAIPNSKGKPLVDLANILHSFDSQTERKTYKRRKLNQEDILRPLRKEAYELGATQAIVKAAKTPEDLLRVTNKLKDREASRDSEPDPRLPPAPFIKGRKLVILANRWSSPPSRSNREKVYRLKRDLESSIKQGKIFSGLKDAEFVDCYQTCKLKSPLHPGLLGGTRMRGQVKDIPNIKELVDKHEIKQIVWLLIGLEGMTVNYNSFREHVAFFEGKDIDIILLIGEERFQWRGAKIDWAHKDWNFDPVNERYWARINLRLFLANQERCRLYSNLALQWDLCGARRTGLAEADALEGRRTNRRHGKYTRKR